MDASVKLRKTIFAAGILILLGIVAWNAARYGADYGFKTGALEGKQALQRLQVVWPNVEQMPETDRFALADLAFQCRLHEKPPVKEEVVKCLTDAANEDAASYRSVLSRLLP